ncbi:RNA polymerase sigma factor [Virgisporangium aurantiacum]|uniref:RNA polymerase sigma factor n=1 Tax=Virgisporangium aurantiacum TaxID=175570 RepID=A0A8J4E7W7_9ACTN|nr:sigma-70 family RNA polymerase sigma factor [Virgisporangium aurantiacum]GIJ64749.1 RNA polymerase sigma factor [Virgisporangium aurantiacum]
MKDFEVFYRTEFVPLVSFLNLFGFPMPEAEDVAQEAMIAMVRHWGTIEHPRAYARRIAVRAGLRNRQRDLERERQLVVGALDRTSASVPYEKTVEDDHWVRRVLEWLPPQQRQVMALTIDGFTPAEISNILTMPANTVRSNLRHARSTLQRALHHERIRERLI